MNTEYPSTVDITEPGYVEVLVSNDGKIVWVNVDGICRFRACRIKQLTIRDEFKDKKAENVHRF